MIDPDKPLTVALSNGVWIQGKITAQDGAPISEATVRVWDHRQRQDAFMGVTDSTGKFKFLAPRGKHKLVVGCNTPGLHMPERDVVLLGSREVSDITDWPEELADTSSGKDLTLADIVIKRTVPIDCLVTFADGRPAAGAQVAIREPSQPGTSRYRSEVKTTDDKGHVKLLTRPLGAQALAVARLTAENVDYRNTGTPLTERDAQGRVKIVLKQATRITGRVLNRGKPVEGAIVLVRSQLADGEISQTVVSTDNQGEFSMTAPEGKHSAAIQKMPQLNQAFRGHKQAKQNRAGDYEFGDLEVNLPLKKIEGQLVDLQGQPIEGAIVQPIPLNPNAPFSASHVQQVTTDSAGNFRFDGLLSGDYDLSIKLPSDRSFKPAKQKITAGNRTTVRVGSRQ